MGLVWKSTSPALLIQKPKPHLLTLKYALYTVYIYYMHIYLFIEFYYFIQVEPRSDKKIIKELKELLKYDVDGIDLE